ncbi:hypothetical protein HU200_065273 [Digitaria exilis]|uniref:F-box domain-containing protein n=1 Tax=Digitaria exilis TaxID=1010633 RepID=A0A835A8C8_9POAL|nr:hypothetical protein HU200_065273 [Digitaria exilis]
MLEYKISPFIESTIKAPSTAGRRLSSLHRRANGDGQWPFFNLVRKEKGERNLRALVVVKPARGTAIRFLGSVRDCSEAYRLYVLGGEILGRLPPRDLAACRCVCRPWRAAALRHMLPHSVRGVFINYYDHDFPHFLARPQGSFGPSIDSTFCCIDDRYCWDSVLDHCNGLILYDHHHREKLYVWNSATRRRVLLLRGPNVGKRELLSAMASRLAQLLRYGWIPWHPAAMPRTGEEHSMFIAHVKRPWVMVPGYIFKEESEEANSYDEDDGQEVDSHDEDAMDGQEVDSDGVEKIDDQEINSAEEEDEAECETGDQYANTDEEEEEDEVESETSDQYANTDEEEKDEVECDTSVQYVNTDEEEEEDEVESEKSDQYANTDEEEVDS